MFLNLESILRVLVDVEKDNSKIIILENYEVIIVDNIEVNNVVIHHEEV